MSERRNTKKSLTTVIKQTYCVGTNNNYGEEKKKGTNFTQIVELSFNKRNSHTLA